MTDNKVSTNAWNRGVFGALIKLFHVIACVQFTYAVYYDFVYVNVPQKYRRTDSNFGGKFKFLTFLNAIIQSFYYTICILNDLFGTNEVAVKKLPAIRRLKDYIFSTFAYPIALNVGITFWALMAVDRELVFPKVFDAFFPNWLNHVMHTNIMIFIMLELFTSFRQYPTRKSGLTGLIVFLAGYLVWVHVIKHYSGVWVYPVLDALGLPQRIVFFAANLLIVIAIYISGEFINDKVWTKEIKQLKAGKKTK